MFSPIRGAGTLLTGVGQCQTPTGCASCGTDTVPPVTLSLLQPCHPPREPNPSALMTHSQSSPPLSLCDVTIQTPFNDIPDQLPAPPVVPGSHKSIALSGRCGGQCKAATSEGQNKEICIPCSAFLPTALIELVFMGFVMSEAGI